MHLQDQIKQKAPGNPKNNHESVLTNSYNTIITTKHKKRIVNLGANLVNVGKLDIT